MQHCIKIIYKRIYFQTHAIKLTLTDEFIIIPCQKHCDYFCHHDKKRTINLASTPYNFVQYKLLPNQPWTSSWWTQVGACLTTGSREFR